MNKKNILFVDDSEQVIKGIQRQLRSYRDQWQLFFATSGPQALELMAQQPIDLIISDMFMPEMHGDALLKIVSERYPGTVRMILSGFADEETLKSGLQIAHQHLSKPCSAEDLRETIVQIFKIQTLVNNPRLIESIGDLNQLPCLPKIYQELNTALAKDTTTTRDLADIFANDMVLSAKLLQLVNSPYFGLNRSISSLSEAINLIGIKKLNSLVISVHIKTAFPVKNLEMEHHMQHIWKNAAQVAELARLIALAENLHDDYPDQSYLGGLLHNMGLLIFLSRGGNQLKTLLEQVRTTETPLPELETNIYGFTRSEAAAYVLSLWKIPSHVVEAILLQNTPNDTTYESVSALTTVHAAACLLKQPDTPDYDRLFEMQLDTDYLKRIDKLERVADWQVLADKVLNHFAEKGG